MEYLKVNLTPKEHKRIFAKISIDTKSNCWRWTGACDQQGYAQGFYKGRKERVHRILYAYFVEPIPRGKGKYRRLYQLHHLCNNTSCCNPDHLKLITQKQNILLGNGITAKYAKQTHCIHGHPLSQGKNRRYCKTCKSNYYKKRINGPNRNILLEKAKEASQRWRNKQKFLYS